MPKLRALIHKVFQNFGLDVNRYHEYDNFSKLRISTMREITDVIDVGANSGQWASEIRAEGWVGPIHSFEPISTYFEELSNSSASDKQWFPYNLAVGSEKSTLEINIAANDGGSSSFLKILPVVTDLQPNTETISKQLCEIERLDNIFKGENERFFYLKADVQGYESDVLLGAKNIIANILAIELEVSLVALYEGQPLIENIITECRKIGFFPAQIRQGFENSQLNHLYQIDILFLKKNQD